MSRAARPCSMPISVPASKAASALLHGWSVPIPGRHNALNALAAIAATSEAGISDEAIRKAMASFSGRQAPLPAHGHLERHRHLRRLRPPSRGDRRRAQGRPRRCARPRHRRGRAASLHARARPLRRVRRLLQRMPTPSSSHRSIRRASCRSTASITWPWPRRSAIRGTRASPPSPASRTSRRCCAASQCPATWWCASVPATAPSGRTRCRSGSAPSRCAREGRCELSRPGRRAGGGAAQAARPARRQPAARRHHLVPRGRAGSSAVHAGRCGRPRLFPARHPGRPARVRHRPWLQPAGARRRRAGRGDPARPRLLRDQGRGRATACAPAPPFPT